MIGQTIAHYRVTAKLGAGGMGEVYLAADEQLGRKVALKFVASSATKDPAAHERLLREARTASALNHPNICTIYEVGEAGELTYIAMECVPGRPLSQEIPVDGLPVERVIRYGMQIADALAHAHQHHIVHCDLKSANVALTPDGRIKVLDFGLARHRLPETSAEVTRSDVSSSEPTSFSGTLQYSAPEILRGIPPEPRTDIWSLGVVLYEMTTGTRPFHGETWFELSSAILRDPPSPLPRTIPPGLRSVIQRCLSKAPGERYQSAAEIRAALEAIHTDVTTTPARKRAPRKRPSRQLRSLAVLPLEDLTGEPGKEYFADGMTEALITALAKINALRVISRTSVMQLKGTRKPLREVAKQLRVDGVIEGSVMREGSRVRVNIQLIHARTDTHLWAESYDREFQNMLALQSEITRAIADEIRVKLAPQEQARLATVPSVRPEAYEDYLRGRYHWNRRTGESLQKAVELFQRAIQQDANFAAAYVGLADSYIILAGHELLSSRDALRKAKAALEKALEIDPGMSEAHASLASVLWEYDRDARRSEEEFQLALSLNPGDSTARRQYAEMLTEAGRCQEALVEAWRALELDPLSLVTNTVVGWLLYHARRYEEAAQQLLKTIDLDRHFPIAREILGQVYLAMGSGEKAMAELRAAVDLAGRTPLYLSSLAHGCGVTGNGEEAGRILAELHELAGRSYVSPLNFAVIHVGLDDTAAALDWLERAQEESGYRFLFLGVSPLFDRLRSLPRFQDLLKRNGLA